MSTLKLEISELKSVVIEGIKNPKNVALIVLGAGTSFIAYQTLKIYFLRRKFRHIPGPPTKGITGYFRGNFNELTEASRNNKVFVEVLADWQKKYGDVYKFQMFNQIFVFTSDRETVKEVLIERNFPKGVGQQTRMGFPMGERFLGLGLLTDFDNERWKHRRSIFNPGFHRQILMSFIEHFNQITNGLSEKFRNMSDGKTKVILFNEINRATLDAIALIAFGMNTDAVNQSESQLNNYLTKVLHILQRNAFDPFMRYRPLRQKEVRDFRNMVKYLRKIGRDKILERIKAYQNNDYVPDDILTSILKEFKDQEFDLETMTDDFITFFVAGQETTANALSFCFLEMGKNPEIAKKAREEVDRVLGEREDVTYQDVNELKYCSAIFKEALRLYPPAPNLTRQLPEPFTILGCQIPEGTQLFISTFVTSRDERYFKDPLKFIPERFMKNSEADVGFQNYVYFPFSLGPRNCIGQNFAQLEGVTVIAKMVQKFDFRLEPSQSMALDQAMTLRPRDGTQVYITIRS